MRLMTYCTLVLLKEILLNQKSDSCVTFFHCKMQLSTMVNKGLF